MRKILVTAISGNISNGILKILLETEDEVYGCDIYDYPVGMDKVLAYWKSDLASSPKYIENLIHNCKKYGITHLIPVNENEIRKINKNKELFNKNQIRVMINSFSIIDTFLDKYHTYQFLSTLDNIHVPKSYRYNEFVEDGKSYIVKLNNSCGSKFLKIIKTKQELEEIAINHDDYIIQQYLENSEEEYTVGVYSNGIKISIIIFRRKLQYGYSSFVELMHIDQIKKEAESIAKAIGLKGYINIQLRKQNDKNYIFEINPRISGTVYFRHLLGFKDVIWWLDLMDSNSNYQYLEKYKTAIGIRELNEKFVVLS